MATYNWNMKQKNIILNNSCYMKLSYLKDFNNLLNPIKNLILICVKENRLVDASFLYKKNLQTCKEI